MLLAQDRVLSVDIGGTHVKAGLLDRSGALVSSYLNLETPHPATPDAILQTVVALSERLVGYSVVAVGFPGYVLDGIVRTAPNLGTTDWAGTNLQQLLQERLNKPARVINDADMLGLGIATGSGLEMVVTLGVGFGTALLLEGKLFPHLEIAHHPICGSMDYDAYVGDRALHEMKVGEWNKRMHFIVGVLERVIHYDTLYLAGGNARLIVGPLPKNVVISTNQQGIGGGARLWRDRAE